MSLSMLNCIFTNTTLSSFCSKEIFDIILVIFFFLPVKLKVIFLGRSSFKINSILEPFPSDLVVLHTNNVQYFCNEYY